MKATVTNGSRPKRKTRPMAQPARGLPSRRPSQRSSLHSNGCRQNQSPAQSLTSAISSAIGQDKQHDLVKSLSGIVINSGKVVVDDNRQACWCLCRRRLHQWRQRGRQRRRRWPKWPTPSTPTSQERTMADLTSNTCGIAPQTHFGSPLPRPQTQVVKSSVPLKPVGAAPYGKPSVNPFRMSPLALAASSGKAIRSASTTLKHYRSLSEANFKGGGQRLFPDPLGFVFDGRNQRRVEGCHQALY